MAFTLKTRVLLGLAAVCMCVVAAPLQVPAEAPAPADNGQQHSRNHQTEAAPVSNDESRGLERTVVPDLPFTGLDVLTLLGVAVILTLLAWVLYRLSAPR